MNIKFVLVARILMKTNMLITNVETEPFKMICLKGANPLLSPKVIFKIKTLFKIAHFQS